MDLKKLTASEIRKLEIAIQHERTRRLNAPKTKRIYFYRDKDRNFELQEELCLSDEQMENFGWTGCEVSCDIEIDSKGHAWATHFAGNELPQKVRI